MLHNKLVKTILLISTGANVEGFFEISYRQILEFCSQPFEHEIFVVNYIEKH